jgi:hypothetical protein
MDTPQSTIQQLFPNHSPAEQKKIEAALDCYLDLVELIYEDIKSVPGLYEQLRALTAQTAARTMGNGRSFTRKYHDTDV